MSGFYNKAKTVYTELATMESAISVDGRLQPHYMFILQTYSTSGFYNNARTPYSGLATMETAITVDDRLQPNYMFIL